MKTVEEISLDYMSGFQSRLNDFFKEKKLTNLKVICSGCEINAHASYVASLSELFRKKLAGQSKTPYQIDLKEEDEKDVRLVLNFLYTGDFEPEVPLQTYLRLADHYEIPILTDICVLQLRSFFSSDQEEAFNENKLFGLQKFAAESRLIKSKNVQSLLEDYFSIRPLAFTTDECLRVISEDRLRDLLRNDRLLMQDERDCIYFGRQYSEKLGNFVDRYCAVNGRIAPGSLKALAKVKKLAKIALPLIAPFSVVLLNNDSFGHHHVSNYGFVKLSSGNTTHAEFPANSWKIVGLQAYISSWDNRHILAGLDVKYENHFTGEQKASTWGENRPEGIYNLETVTVPPGDVIVGAKIRSGWCIDSLTFVTRAGVELGPLGTSEGGTLHELNFPELVDAKDDTFVGLHGFKFTTIKTLGQQLWNELNFCCSVIPSSVISAKFPFIDKGRVSKFFAEKQLLW